MKRLTIRKHGLAPARRVADLEAAIAERDAAIEALCAEHAGTVKVLMERIGDLECRLGLNSTNSSKPNAGMSGSKPSRVGAAKRKPGRQPGRVDKTLRRRTTRTGSRATIRAAAGCAAAVWRGSGRCPTPSARFSTFRCLRAARIWIHVRRDFLRRPLAAFAAQRGFAGMSCEQLRLNSSRHTSFRFCKGNAVHSLHCARTKNARIAHASS